MTIDVQASITPDGSQFYFDVLRGLEESPKRIPCKYLYDDRGCQLYHQICELPEYYLTRRELQLIGEHAKDIAKLVGPAVRLVELGAGRGQKTHILLDQCDVDTFIPVEISTYQLELCRRELGRRFSDLKIRPICADYTGDFSLSGGAAHGRTVFYFSGSSIGNMSPPQARRFLRRLSYLAGERGGLLVAVDLVKDRAVLQAAYDDSRGVTAAFNKNLLRRINRECGAEFDLRAFRHTAPFDEDHHRIEMRLISLRQQWIHFPTQAFHFGEGEPLVTEHCYKYTIDHFATLAEEANWRVRAMWTDDDQWFSLWYLVSDVG